MRTSGGEREELVLLEAGEVEDARPVRGGCLADVAAAVAVGLPGELVEAVVEPVAEVGAGATPGLVGEVGHVDVEDGAAVDGAWDGGVDRGVRGRGASEREGGGVDAIVGLFSCGGLGRCAAC